jgi:sodium/potassium-transporting ATPase subunit beta
MSISAGVLINIECKAWAKNIIHDRQDRRGSVHFELMIDEAPKQQKKEL